MKLEEIPNRANIRRYYYVLIFVVGLLLLIGYSFLSKPQTEIEETQQYEKFEIAANKLKAALEDKNYTSVDEAAKEVMKTGFSLKNYIEENPETEGGAKMLGVVAIWYRVVDTKTSYDTDKAVAETYYLLIDLYPKDKEALKAKRWLRVNGYDVG